MGSNFRGGGNRRGDQCLPQCPSIGKNRCSMVASRFPVPIETRSHHHVLLLDGEHSVALARSQRGHRGLLLWETSARLSLLCSSQLS